MALNQRNTALATFYVVTTCVKSMPCFKAVWNAHYVGKHALWTQVRLDSSILKLT